MTNKASYWERRRAQMMYEQMDIAEKAADTIGTEYRNTAKYVHEKIKKNYAKTINKFKISDEDMLELMKEAKAGSYNDLINMAERKGMTELASYLKQSGQKYKYERLMEQAENIDNAINNLAGKESSMTSSALKEVSESTYYKSIYEIQKHTGLAFSFNEWDEKLFSRLAGTKWSGENYSKRIWNNTDELAATLKSEIIQGFITGKTQKEMYKVIMERFGVSAFNAKRIVRTESCYAANEMEMQSYEECGIDTYIFVATLDLRTSDVCAALDGKVFKVKDAMPGVNMPPMHPFCRSTTIENIETETLKKLKRRARNPVTGKNELVPADMTYKQWHKKYVGDDASKDKLGIITNNNKSNPRYYDFNGKSVSEVEKEIGKFDYEVAVAFDKTGKAVFCQLQEGADHEVHFTKHQLRKMNGLDITHNHPYNTPPSPEDLYIMVNHNAASIRATGKKCTYILNNTEELKNLPSFDIFNEEYNKLYDLRMEKYHKKIQTGQMTGVEAEIAIQEEVWEVLTKKYKISLLKQTDY